ncbi:MAG: hypothetical protein BWY26_00448 [Elusimicrobia bacterium ADurb.Bin231]|nr:MAG: hypothetical protein BWY26_00448 [Elusimicrobia bacterium ADurb.Bin231]
MTLTFPAGEQLVTVILSVAKRNEEFRSAIFLNFGTERV